MNDYLDHIQIFNTITKLRERNEILMDSLVNLLSRTIQYCHKNNIPIEDEEIIKTMIYDSRKLLNNLTNFSPNFKHPNGTPREETEPKNFSS
jgi:hypothetical protein